MRRKRLRLMLFLAVGFGVTGLGVLAYATDAINDLELDTVDLRFSLRGDTEPPANLVYVKIDDVTFDDLNRRWQDFGRSLHGDVIDQIAPDRPKVIAYDVQFTEPSEKAEFKQDLDFAEAILNADGRVVLATTEVNENGKSKFLGGPPDVLRDLDGKVGNGRLPTDPGGVFRRLDHSVDKLPALSVVAAEVATGSKVDPDGLGGDSAWIDYHGGPNTIQSVSFSRVAQGKLKRGFFRDKLVIVGPYSPTLQDVHPTSTTASDEQMAGVEIQANALSTVLRDFPLQDASRGVEIALIVLLGLAVPLASLRLSAPLALGFGLALGVAFAFAVQIAFNSGTVLAFVYPLGTLVLATVGALAVHLVTGAFERERIRDMFSRFVPENVVDEVLASTDGLRLGGVQREGTVMFSDLRGFTSFAEKLPVEQVIDILNRYLTAMSDAILAHGGTLVAYMGDGIMAVFGAPVPQDDHADRALAAAREMLGPRLEGFNESLRAQGAGEGFRMGIGLNSGEVMSGNVGSEQRLEYTAIGDTTNTAARLEGMTKGTPHQLFIADSTRSFLRQQPDDLIFVDEFEVRGREAKIKLWSVADEGSGLKEQPAAEPASGA
jgi:adenylate cyclase